MTLPAQAPRQARSVATRERLLKAAEALIAARGYDGFTLADVAERADVAVGSIYQRIGNKEDLVLAVYDRHLGQLDRETLAVYDPREFEGLSPHQTVRAAVAGLARLIRRHRDFLRVTVTQSMIRPELKARGHLHVTTLAELFESALLAHAWPHPDPETAVDVCFRFTWSTLMRRVTHGPTFESRRPISESRLVELLGDACIGLLEAS